jgi:hypothetical protein
VKRAWAIPPLSPVPILEECFGRSSRTGSCASAVALAMLLPPPTCAWSIGEAKLIRNFGSAPIVPATRQPAIIECILLVSAAVTDAFDTVSRQDALKYSRTLTKD